VLRIKGKGVGFLLAFGGGAEQARHGIHQVLVVSWMGWWRSRRRSLGVGSSRTAARPRMKRKKRQI
jgi:hypothetical protein